MVLNGIFIEADDCQLRDFIRSIVQEELAKAMPKREWEGQAGGLVSRKDAAKMLQMSETTLWRWSGKGIITPVTVGKKILYRREDIDRLLGIG